jgi:hypothetical protein
MPRAVYNLGRVVNMQNEPAQFEVSRVAMSRGYDLKHRNPGTASVNEQQEGAGALDLGTLWCVGKFQTSIRP